MKAIAVFPKLKKIDIIEIPEPEIQSPDEVLFRVLGVGICGTDREIARFDYGTPPDGADSFVLGHECLGEVVKVGAKVTRFRPGDLVVPTVRRPCDVACDACIRQQSDMCYSGLFHERGIGRANGYMTRLVVERELYLTRLSPGLREVGVLLEPLTISEKAVEQMALIQRRLPWMGRPDAAGGEAELDGLVLGAGPVGCLSALLLRISGFNAWVLSREPATAPVARLLETAGVHYISSQGAGAARTPEEVAKTIGHIDVMIEATGAAQFAFDYMPVLGVNGIYILTGIPAMHRPVSIDGGAELRNLVLKNQVVLGTVNANITAFGAGARHLEELAQRFPEALNGLVTARVPFEKYRDYLFDKPATELKTVLTFEGA